MNDDRGVPRGLGASIVLVVALLLASGLFANAGRPAGPKENGLIAFTSTLAGNTDIAVLDLCGRVTTLIGGPTADLRPSWSPDGRRLAFMSNRDGNFEIYLADANGSNVRRLTEDPGNDFNPDWSPDGKAIAWNSDRIGD